MISPFDGLNKLQINKLFDLLSVHQYRYHENEEILPTIKNENIICIILQGYAQIIYMEYNGDEILMENLYKNDVFGTNISGTNNDNCEIIARDDKEVVKTAVQNKGLIVKYASLRLRSDKEIAKIAVTQDKRAFQFLSKELKNDEEVKSWVK